MAPLVSYLICAALWHYGVDARKIKLRQEVERENPQQERCFQMICDSVSYGNGCGNIREDRSCPENCNRRPRGNMNSPCYCGQYQISREYFQQCKRDASGTLNLPMGNFARCMDDSACSERCVMNYVNKYSTCKERVTCQDKIKIHKQGPDAICQGIDTAVTETSTNSTNTETSTNSTNTTESTSKMTKKTQKKSPKKNSKKTTKKTSKKTTKKNQQIISENTNGLIPCTTVTSCIGWICGMVSNNGTYGCGDAVQQDRQCPRNCWKTNNTGPCRCGMYQFTETYFRDCSTGPFSVPINDLSRCAVNQACATKCVNNYIQRHAFQCTKSYDAMTCEDIALTHFGGASCKQKPRAIRLASQIRDTCEANELSPPAVTQATGNTTEVPVDLSTNAPVDPISTGVNVASQVPVSDAAPVATEAAPVATGAPVTEAPTAPAPTYSPEIQARLDLITDPVQKQQYIALINERLAGGNTI